MVVTAIGTSDRRGGWRLVLLALINVLIAVVPEIRAQEARTAGLQDVTVDPSSMPDVLLNHFYIVLDEPTFRDLRTNRFFVQEFAAVDTGLPRFLSPDDRSQTLYVRGRTTYLELMGPSNSFDEPVGKCGIGLTVEQPGSIARVRDALARVFPGEIENALVDWTNDVDHPVPWYQVVHRSRSPEHPDLSLWVSEYHPDFFPWLDPGLDLHELGIARSRFLKPRYRPDRLLENVTRITIAADESGRAALAKQLGALGYASNPGPAGEVTLRAKEAVFELVEPSDARTGIISIECRLNRRLGSPRVERFGPRSVLTIETDGTARWSF